MLNLITDPWIPVRRRNGCDVIRPDQIAETDVMFPDWPCPDLNLACLELLIGLVYLAAPPESVADWTSRAPEPEALRKALAPLAPAFDLLGDGPRFMQDFDRDFDVIKRSPNVIKRSPKLVDMLFIDSAGNATAKKNTDLMVKRKRYKDLSLNLAAMALYTLQNFAPKGGSGNRTSMRGGGPMVTLVRPDAAGLWPLIWANVPEGEPLAADDLVELPWMRPTETSKEEQVTPPPEENNGLCPEMFFGQPRRLRLLADGDRVTGVIQAPWGTNYQGWVHQFSPYHHTKTGKSPKHPKPGPFGYRNWRGIILKGDGGDRARCLSRFTKHRGTEAYRLLVGGWAVSDMKPLDFIWSEAPVFALDAAGEGLAGRLVEAAEHAGYALASSVRDGRGEADIGTGAGARVREMFFRATQASFEAMLGRIAAKQGGSVGTGWLTQMRGVAMGLFDGEVMPGLADLSETRRQKAVKARQSLLAAFSGYGKAGGKIYKALDLELPKHKRKTKAEVVE